MTMVMMVMATLTFTVVGGGMGKSDGGNDEDDDGDDDDDADDDNDGVADDGDGAVLFTLGQGKAGKAEPCIQKCEYLQSDRSVFSKVVSGSCQRQQNFV